jgi:hypothetical protein
MEILDILGDLQKGAVAAAKDVAIGSLKEAANDAIDFVEKALPSLNRYFDLLLRKDLTEDEFKSLVLGLRDLAEMTGLTMAGLAAIKVEETRNSILNAVTSVALGAVAKLK